MPAERSPQIGQQVNVKHLEELKNNILETGEALLGVFHGKAVYSDSGHGLANAKGGISLHDYLIVTDRRVIMWARGIFSRTVDGFYYNDISSVEEIKGLLLGAIVLNVRGLKERMESMIKSDVPIAASMIRDQISNDRSVQIQNSPVTPSTPPIADITEQIRKLAELKDAGILTPEEFSSKKSELLSKTYPQSLCHYELENASIFSCSSLNSFGVRFPSDL